MEIKNRWNGEIIITGKYVDIKEATEKNKADLSYADLSYANLSYADLSSADLRYANLRYADLSSADLHSADLRSADLSYADLSYADLSYANLRSADLSYANLSSAKGIDWLKPYTLNDFIKEYKIKKDGDYIFVYKGVSPTLKSPLSNNKIKYDIGKTIKVIKANPDFFTVCTFGIHLSPTIEAAKEFGTKIIECKVHIGDIVVIPIEHNKFRVKKCKVIRVVDES